MARAPPPSGLPHSAGVWSAAFRNASLTGRGGNVAMLPLGSLLYRPKVFMYGPTLSWYPVVVSHFGSGAPRPRSNLLSIPLNQTSHGTYSSLPARRTSFTVCSSFAACAGSLDTHFQRLGPEPRPTDQPN